MDLIINNFIVKKSSPTCYTLHNNTKKSFPFTVEVLPRGIKCDCREFYRLKTCVHVRLVCNMHYVMDTNPDSLLHAQYADLVDEAITHSDNETQARLSTLDEIVCENNKAFFGKYYSRDNGIFLSIEVLK